MLEELPFDQYQRYGALAMAAGVLREKLGRPLRILDVGDWNGLVARFCPSDRTVWLDPTGAGSGRYVVADGASLPFADGAFDLVASLDTLEHVERGRRGEVAAELRRVAAHAVVVAAPIADDGAAACERELYDYVWDMLGGEQQQLREHEDHGLPTRAELRALLAAPEWTIAETPSGLLSDWLAMMVAKHALLAAPESDLAHRAIDRRYNRRYGAVDPARPAYRQILFAGRGDAVDLPRLVLGKLGAVREQADAEDAAVARSVLLGAHARRAGSEVDLLSLVDPDPRLLAQTSRALERELSSLRMRRDAAHLALVHERERSAALAALVAGYERGRFIRWMAALSRLRRRLGLDRRLPRE